MQMRGLDVARRDEDYEAVSPKCTLEFSGRLRQHLQRHNTCHISSPDSRSTRRKRSPTLHIFMSHHDHDALHLRLGGLCLPTSSRLADPHSPNIDVVSTRSILPASSSSFPVLSQHSRKNDRREPAAKSTNLGPCHYFSASELRPTVFLQPQGLFLSPRPSLASQAIEFELLRSITSMQPHAIAARPRVPAPTHAGLSHSHLRFLPVPPYSLPRVLLAPSDLPTPLDDPPPSHTPEKTLQSPLRPFILNHSELPSRPPLPHPNPSFIPSHVWLPSFPLPISSSVSSHFKV
ncbi:hypothetical protein V8E36_007332 [Tilletia maclaganii]